MPFPKENPPLDALPKLNPLSLSLDDDLDWKGLLKVGGSVKENPPAAGAAAGVTAGVVDSGAALALNEKGVAGGGPAGVVLNEKAAFVGVVMSDLAGLDAAPPKENGAEAGGRAAGVVVGVDPNENGPAFVGEGVGVTSAPGVVENEKACFVDGVTVAAGVEPGVVPKEKGDDGGGFSAGVVEENWKGDDFGASEGVTALRENGEPSLTGVTNGAKVAAFPCPKENVAGLAGSAGFSAGMKENTAGLETSAGRGATGGVGNENGDDGASSTCFFTGSVNENGAAFTFVEGNEKGVEGFQLPVDGAAAEDSVGLEADISGNENGEVAFGASLSLAAATFGGN